jgi:MoCo/4Fe-4S cofactor protein with predicted Tat translocation signal
MIEPSTGKRYWQSLGELQNMPEFEEMLHREFPEAASEFPEGVSRRRWLQLMGASFALAGVTGCRYQQDKLVALSARPVDRVPGKPQKYATSIELAGGVRHLLMTCFDGRPLKVEGNADHPAGQRGTDAWAQACILGLYDPDRGTQLVQREGQQARIRTWTDFDDVLDGRLRDWKTAGGEGLAVLVEPSPSLSLASMLDRLQQEFPAAKVYQHTSVPKSNPVQGARSAWGQPCRARLSLDQTRVIVALDADLLTDDPDSLSMARDFAAGRDPDGSSMNRLYAVESQFTVTGASADHRLAVKSSEIGGVLDEIEQLVEQHSEAGQVAVDASAAKRDRILRAIADDLLRHAGRSVVVAGWRQPPEVHARVYRLNARLDNVGKTITFLEDPLPSYDDLKTLVSDVSGGKVQSLVILGGNPAYDAPADLDVESALSAVGTSIHLSVDQNETSRLCDWYLPGAHAFESWGDVRAWDGTVSVTQPLIEPLCHGRSALELLARMCGDRREPQMIVRQAIDARWGGSPLTQAAWQRLLHDGYLEGSRLPPVEVQPVEVTEPAGSTPGQADQLEVVFCTDPAVYDGRFANNGWLQETPRFLSKLTWDNAALISPRTAERLGIEHGELIQISAGDQSLQIPAFVLPGQAEDSIGVALGYGRTAAGMVGGDPSAGIAPVGVNANQLRTSDSPFLRTGVSVTGTGQSYPLATTQDHHAIDRVGMDETRRRIGVLIREADLDEYQEHPDFAQHLVHHPPLKSLWTEFSFDGHAWGMSIDLNKCIGCNACMLACQSENNVPVVGKEQVSRSREMHWIRVDRYFSGDLDDPQAVHQPVTCQQCELAPCEQVCPVAATVHSDEGLNDMVYNRCIGTRYCGNNCPYKVRRFNYFDYTKPLHTPGRELVQLSVNPEVTVRSRGVMEKCTYCVQRIQNGKIDAKAQRRTLQDGQIMTACQQACPTQAIEFGDLNESGSRVARAHASPRSYAILAELNIKPRTEYLARVRNPHPALVEKRHKHHGPTHPADDQGHGNDQGDT